VFPTEIPAASPNEAPLIAFATKAQTVTAGQNWRPSSSSPANAIPVGAQTGVITPRATESSIPSFAAAT